MDERDAVGTPLDAERLRATILRLEGLAGRRRMLGASSEAPATRARQLRELLAGHVRLRLQSLETPLVVLLLGPTGSGKSTLFNTLAGRAISPTGILRPTTRKAIAFVNPGDEAALREGILTGIDEPPVGEPRVLVEADNDVAPGLALFDAPDLDSVELGNRELADQLVERADLCFFLTTATRYADRVPWRVLARIGERGLPLVVVVNRLPSDRADRDAVLGDVVRLFKEAGLDSGLDPSGKKGLEIIGVTEGALDTEREALDPAAAASITARVAHLRADRDARLALAARALAGSLAGLGPLVDLIADDAAHEAIDVGALRRAATDAYERELDGLRDELGRGRFLREEALRHWQAYVGADDVTRVFSNWIGSIRGTIMNLVRPTAAPVAELREATTDDLLALARVHAAEAARRTATAWSGDLRLESAIGPDASLWGPSEGFDERLRARLDEWIASIGQDIMEAGAGKRRLARGATIGVNAVSIGVVLATFIHTAGLTGAEVGVAAATAFVNQKLLGALFGEAAMAELIRRARARLVAALALTFGEERARFEALVPAQEELEDLVEGLRAAATELRTLSPSRSHGGVSSAASRGCRGTSLSARSSTDIHPQA
jgi:energy-coupling factor transporter ATP-binding protein EcfA2